MDSLEIRQRIRDIVEPTIVRLGFDLVAIEWTGNERGKLLRLSIDGRGGVGIDNCAEVSHRISPLLDEADPIAVRYQLEVSSPGIERPVQRRDDFARFAGYRARIRLFEGHPRRKYTGVLGGVEEDEVRITVDGVEHLIAYDSIERAHLDLDLDQYQRLAEFVYGSSPREDST